MTTMKRRAQRKNDIVFLDPRSFRLCISSHEVGPRTSVKELMLIANHGETKEDGAKAVEYISLDKRDRLVDLAAHSPQKNTRERALSKLDFQSLIDAATASTHGDTGKLALEMMKRQRRGMDDEYLHALKQVHKHAILREVRMEAKNLIRDYYLEKRNRHTLFLNL